MCLKSNENESISPEMSKLRHQLRRTLLLDVQYKFQLDSFNTSGLTASCVSVCSSDALRKWRNEISSSVARSNFASNLKKTHQKFTKKLKRAYGEHAVSRAQVLVGI